MNRQSFVITVSVGGASRVSVWDSAEPLRLGYRLPWQVERHGEELRLNHDKGHTIRIKPEIIENGSSVRLPRFTAQDPDLIAFQIRQTWTPRPVYEHEKPLSRLKRTEWHVYMGSGKWVYRSRMVRPTERFIGKAGPRHLFSVHREGDLFIVKPLSEKIRVNGKLASGEFRFTGHEFASTAIEFGNMRWWFNEVEIPAAPPEQPDKKKFAYLDPEWLWFKKALQGASVAFVILVLTSVFLGHVTEEEQEEQKEASITVAVNLKPAIPPAPLPTVKPQELPDIISKAVPKPKEVVTPPKEVIAPKVQEVVQPKVAQPGPTGSKAGAAGPIMPPQPTQVAQGKTEAVKAPSKALLAAQALLRSSKQLAQSGGAPGLLAKSDIPIGSDIRKRHLGSMFAGGSAGDTVAMVPKVDLTNREDVAVDYSDVGNPNGKGNISYKWSQPGRAKVPGGTGDSFVSVSVGWGVPNMAENGLTKKEVRDVIDRHMSEIRYCYEKAIVRRPDIEGKMIVDFVIGGSGDVERSSVKTSTLPDSFLDQCLLTRLNTWQFPEPKGNVKVGVAYPFVFKRI